MKTGIAVPIELEETDVRGSMMCGLRQNWLSAENDDLSADLDCGAGLGGPWLQLSIAVKGQQKRYFRYDMRKFMECAIAQLTAEKDHA